MDDIHGQADLAQLDKMACHPLVEVL
jgi:hypothetical protein